MRASQPESPRAERVRSLEVRWIFPGQLAAPVTGWFGRIPAPLTVVEDIYLLDPHLPDPLSCVKRESKESRS